MRYSKGWGAALLVMPVSYTHLDCLIYGSMAGLLAYLVYAIVKKPVSYTHLFFDGFEDRPEENCEAVGFCLSLFPFPVAIYLFLIILP